MSSSNAQRLPSLGTTFETAAAFKLNCFEIALSASYELGVWKSSTADRPRAVLRCWGLGGRKQYARSGRACSCYVEAYPNANGDFEVIKVNDKHSCGFDGRGNKAGAARTSMRSKLAALQELAAAGGKKKRTSWSVQKEDTEDEGDSGDSAREEDEEEEELSTTRCGRSAVKPDFTLQAARDHLARSRPDHPDEGKELYEILEAGQKTRYPPKAALREAIAALASGDPLDLPSPDVSFSSVASICTHLYAYGQQRGFNMQRTIKAYGLRFICAEQENGVRCGWDKVAVEKQDGSWGLAERTSETQHDYDCERGTSPTASATPSPAPPPVLSACPPQPNVFFPPLLPPLRQNKRPCSLSPSPSSRVTKTAALPAPSTSKTLLQPNDILSFLTSALPSLCLSDAESAARSLQAGRIADRKDLEGLLEVEDDTLDAALEMLEEGEGGGATGDSGSRVACRAVKELRRMYKQGV